MIALLYKFFVVMSAINFSVLGAFWIVALMGNTRLGVVIVCAIAVLTISICLIDRP